MPAIGSVQGLVGPVAVQYTVPAIGSVQGLVGPVAVHCACCRVSAGTGWPCGSTVHCACYRVSAGTGWPCCSTLCLGAPASLICQFYLGVAASILVSADLPLRRACMLLGC